MVKEQDERVKAYERGEGLLQKIADGRVEVKCQLLIPKFKNSFKAPCRGETNKGEKMSNLELRLEATKHEAVITTPVYIGEDENLHIEGIDVFTGDDDYKETDRVSIKTTGTELEILKKLYTKEVESTRRLRYEPAVTLHLRGEGSDPSEYLLTLSHHKGQVLLDCRRIYKGSGENNNGVV